MTELQVIEYRSIEGLTIEENALESFTVDYLSNASYLDDLIHEVADDYTPTYYNDIWEDAQTIAPYVEDAVREGLVDTRDFDLVKTMQAGYYELIRQAIQENIEDIIYNIGVETVNQELNDYSEEELDSMGFDLDELEDRLKQEMETLDTSYSPESIGDNARSVFNDYMEEVNGDEE